VTGVQTCALPIVPIYRKDEERERVLAKADEVSAALRAAGVRTHVDARDTLKPGPKFYEWERKGVPLRVEIGPKDMDAQQLTVVTRLELDGIPRKEAVPESQATSVISA